MVITVMIFGVNTNRTKSSGELPLWLYHPDGTPKRSVGHWYPDIGCEWTREMEEDQ